jgi:uncharacterized protein YjiS (DUF1127 family)
LRRLVNGRSREQMLATKPRCKILGCASVADALRQNLLRLARVLRRFILAPYARRRRRRVAIAQLRSLDDHLLADIGLTSGQRRAQGKECPEWRDWRRERNCQQTLSSWFFNDLVTTLNPVDTGESLIDSGGL